MLLSYYIMRLGATAAAAEKMRAKLLAKAVDGALDAIVRSRVMEHGQALALAQRVRRLAERLFPDKMATFDLIYRPRLERAIRERFPQQ
ncbi:MAG: hypothetical protein K9K66_18925 [Desulfarculaceae bacterium]|nr:hypothetical protein [Desulfarculaceae bacterium]MCF8071933.1 hypothetical protein [Desulfarculaceae bacterium]MCF8103733.1 hypothetical protein [Desulfarculaceae bacterium]MCF8115000.1 hypothetical protein [Desulfarculaceae bacterium]